MKIIFSTVVVLLWATQAIAQHQSKPQWKDLAGIWKGYYLENGQERPLNLVFDDNQRTWTVDIPDLVVAGAACEWSICEAGDFHITKSGLGKSMTFVGKPDGNIMTGICKVGDSCGPGRQMEFKVERRHAVLEN